jgi:galactokinase
MRARFRLRFGRESEVFRAPGRVNLIGEHTDYNDGFVMPAAIGFYTWVAVAPREDRTLLVRSENFGEEREIVLDALAPGGPVDWSSYVAGVAWVLEAEGRRLRGADMLVWGGVPIGAGLSSSAAIEVASGLALLAAAGSEEVDRAALARQCQRAENDYVGMRCGIMDPFISCKGQAGDALMLDCRSLDFELLPVPADARLVICNTMVKHALTGGEYNERRAACEEGVRILSARLPAVRALRDVSPAQLEMSRDALPERIYRRCLHVVTEDERVAAAADDLREGNLAAFGARMAASHASLRDDFEVSCPELDLMVALASSLEGVYGARMTGGGFGGCTINLVRKESVPSFRESVAAAYRRKTGLAPDIYACTPAEGASRQE